MSEHIELAVQHYALGLENPETRDHALAHLFPLVEIYRMHEAHRPAVASAIMPNWAEYVSQAMQAMEEADGHMRKVYNSLLGDLNHMKSLEESRYRAGNSQ